MDSESEKRKQKIKEEHEKRVREINRELSDRKFVQFIEFLLLKEIQRNRQHAQQNNF